MAASRNETSFAWKRPAVLAVVLALLLCTSALVLATRQSGALFELRLSDLRAQAKFLAYQLGDDVADRCDRAMMPLAIAVESGPTPQVVASDDWPDWLGSPALWSDGAVEKISLRFAGGSRLEIDGMTRSSLDSLIRLALSVHPQSGISRPGTPSVRLFSGFHDGRLMVVAYRPVSVRGTPEYMVALVDTRALAMEFERAISTLTPLIRLETGDGDGVVWRESLGAELHFWSLVPLPVYVSALRTEMWGQMAVNVLATVAAVTALLSLVGGLVRVARREAALSKLKSDFVADVSHELKTPLALIRMFGEMLLSGRVASPEKAKEYYEIITRESDRLTHLIDNILDFSRNNAGKSTYEIQPVDIASVVRRTYESYRHELDRLGFEHKLTIEDNLPTVNGDGDAISQAVLNLLGNAVKYSDTDKSVMIQVARETRRDHHGVLISVHDRGIGIRPEDRAHLFDGFYRGTGDQVRKRRGTGLGLAVVKQVVEAHGGSVEAEPRLVKGSTFRIFLPPKESASDEPNTLKR